MNKSLPGPFPDPDPGWVNLSKLADRIEKHVRMYWWLTFANVIVFGTNVVLLLLLLIARLWTGV